MIDLDDDLAALSMNGLYGRATERQGLEPRDALPGPRTPAHRIDALGRATTFDLDGLDRVVQETDALSYYRTFTWDGVNRTAETDKRHHRTLFEYDRINRLKKTTDPPPFETQTVETTYEDALNRVTEKDRRGFLKRTQMDPPGRVVNVTRAVGQPEEATLERNTYDPVGNKETQTDAEDRVT